MISSMWRAAQWIAGMAFVAVPSVAIAHDVSAVRYFAENGQVQVATEGTGTTANSLFAIASVGKTFTAVAVLALASAGKLDIEDDVTDWVAPEIAKGLGGLSGLKIRHLLTMTSGLPDYYVEDYLTDALADPDQVQNPQTALSYAYDEGTLFDPGEAFDYSNTNYVLLGLIIEQATGESYARALGRLVFHPAGMINSFVFGTRALPASFVEGHEDDQHVRDYYAAQGFGDGGVISNAPDLAKFYLALFEDGSLLKPEFLNLMLHDPVGEGYGMGIEVNDGIYGHSGGDLGFASDVRYDAASGAIAIVLIADGNANAAWAEDRLLKQP